TYTVVAANNATQDYTVTVTVAANPAKAITAFGFAGLSPAVTGTVNESNKTIALTVPYGTNVTALVPTFTTTGASVKVGSTAQVSGTTPQNFTAPVTYTVVAANSTTQDYTVTVSVSSAPTQTSTSTPTQTPTPEPTKPKVDVFKSSVVNEVNLIKAIESMVAEANKTNQFTKSTDTKGHWAEKTIDTFMKLHAINGYGDGQFKPNGNITRAEFAALISRIFNISGGTNHSVSLSDVSNHWAADAIEKLVSAGVLGGYGDGTFKPDQTISREEIVIILTRIVNLDNVNKDTSKGKFKDISRASSYALNAIKDAAEAGIITGKNDGEFDPQGNTTRAEALTVILNVLKLDPQLKILLDGLK
ncbi:S-layer homology domain-containing protein, partial [Paenibacillus pectinilyticus]|uniref:S-layer homology domain-containing protein n=1 Tax=Paenibacillus pectinilyticus TaxID=512399 RepID=UPI000B15D7F7